MPLLQKTGARLLFLGQRQLSLAGRRRGRSGTRGGTRQSTQSRTAFVQMTLTPEYAEIAVHRAAGLEGQLNIETRCAARSRRRVAEFARSPTCRVSCRRPPTRSTPVRRAHRASSPMLAVLTILPARIHSFLPDGGAGVIANLTWPRAGSWWWRCSTGRGATQLVFGIVMLLAAMRYRSFAPLVLLLLLVERRLHALHFWGALPQSHRPPEHLRAAGRSAADRVRLRLSLRDRA